MKPNERAARAAEKQRRRRWLGALLAAVCLAAVGFGYLVEYRGGQGNIPTWGQLYALLGLDTGTPEPEALAPGTPAVLVLDVGQGDAVLLAQDGAYCLIDAGPYDARQELLAALRGLGVTKLDYLVLTHPHADHMGGMTTVLQNFAVQTLLLPELTASDAADNVLAPLLRQAETQGTTAITAEQGQEYPLGAGTLTVLLTGVALTADSHEDATNNASLCLRYASGDFSFLDTGDAEAAEEAALVAQYGGALNATLLKAGHHGSSTSNTQALLSAVMPQAVAVSCGLDNDYGHPHQSVLRRLAENEIEVYRTDTQGGLAFTAPGGKLQEQGDGQRQALAPAA